MYKKEKFAEHLPISHGFHATLATAARVHAPFLFRGSWRGANEVMSCLLVFSFCVRLDYMHLHRYTCCRKRVRAHWNLNSGSFSTGMSVLRVGVCVCV